MWYFAVCTVTFYESWDINSAIGNHQDGLRIWLASYLLVLDSELRYLHYENRTHSLYSNLLWSPVCVVFSAACKTYWLVPSSGETKLTCLLSWHGNGGSTIFRTSCPPRQGNQFCYCSRWSLLRLVILSWIHCKEKKKWHCALYHQWLELTETSYGMAAPGKPVAMKPVSLFKFMFVVISILSIKFSL